MMYKPTVSNTLNKLLIAALLGLSILTSPLVFADRQQAAEYYEDAVILHKNGKNKEAVIQLKNALQQDAGLLPARVLLGTIYMETGDNQSAEKELHEAERLGADRSLTAVPLARSYLKQHKYEELISELTLENYPAGIHGELLSFRGLAYLELLDFDNARKSFTEALKLIPGSPDPYNGMAMLALRQGEINTSARNIEKASAA
jgi:Flp pilus assembly protein TadD